MTPVRLMSRSAESAVRDVHRDFKAETQIGEGRGSPLHSVCLLIVGVKCVSQLVAAVALTGCPFFTAISMQSLGLGKISE